MPSFSNTQILGHCGQDARSFTTSSGTMGVNLSVAVSTGKDKPPTWFKVAVFRNEGEYSRIQYEIASQCKKGDLVLVSGKIGIDSWADKASGEARSQPALTAREFYRMGGYSDKTTAKIDDLPPAAEYPGAGPDEDCPF